jgi:hypothetical protein
MLTGLGPHSAVATLAKLIRSHAPRLSGWHLSSAVTRDADLGHVPALSGPEPGFRGAAGALDFGRMSSPSGVCVCLLQLLLLQYLL